MADLKFYSKDGAVVLKTRDWVNHPNWQSHTVHLADGERVIGYKSLVFPGDAVHYDFQLIIGRLI